MRQISTACDELSILKEDFLASLNHELRTPLSGVIGMVDLVLETELTGEQKEYLDDARLCAENLLQILNSTLEFSALSADQVVLEEADFPLHSMLEGVLDDFAFKAKAKALRLVRNLSPATPEVAHGDALHLKQIVSQLIANAIKFTTRGQIEVDIGVGELETTGFILNVKISDTGIGISEDQLGRIFQAFQQLESGLARRYTGMGLGLAVTQKLVQLMNGEIGVTSRVGHGTEFSIGIPLGFAREVMSNSRPDGGPAHDIRILLVEDDPVAQTIAARILHRRPYRVDCANSGTAALQAARTVRYHLVLMDLHMPDMDGFETAERIRNLAGYGQTPIVALTANGSAEYREVCARQGMQGFIEKPVQSSELLSVVENLLLPVKGPVPVDSLINRIAV